MVGLIKKWRSRPHRSSYEIDMCSGALIPKLCAFAIPLALSSILQLLFNAADIIVVGKFAGSTALAAVGSTGSLINLIVNLFIGLSVGTNVLVSRYYGSRQRKELRETVHTSVAVSLVGGVILIFLGFFIAKPALELMGSPDNVIGQATLYMQIFFLGMPANMLYNFGAAILRSVGDTKRPLYFLLLAGIINVILNLFFVIVFHLDVAGVALATVISQYVSAALVFLCLLKSNGPYYVRIQEIRITKDKLIALAKIGLPAGMQGAIFSISNVLIQSSINSFGSTAMAGSTAASNLEGFVYAAMNAFHQSALSFTGQNIGAKKYERVNRILLSCLFLVTIVGLVLGVGAYLLGTPLLSIYSSDPEVIKYGLERMLVICTIYFLCGAMDIFVGSLRGMGYSMAPMIVSIAGVCGFRVLWIYTVFAAERTLFVLYLSYPISWIITGAIHALCYVVLHRRMMRKAALESA